MTRFTLTLARVCLSAWVGAAVLFVINGIRLATEPSFDSVIRNRQAVLRFPPYYALGFVLVTTGLLAAFVSRNSAALSRRRWIGGVICAAAALAVMSADYFVVYLPMEAMITPPDTARPAEFVSYHHWSERLNSLHVGLAFLAAVVLSLPPRSRSAVAVEATSSASPARS